MNKKQNGKKVAAPKKVVVLKKKHDPATTLAHKRLHKELEALKQKRNAAILAFKRTKGAARKQARELAQMLHAVADAGKHNASESLHERIHFEPGHSPQREEYIKAGLIKPDGKTQTERFMNHEQSDVALRARMMGAE